MISQTYEPWELLIRWDKGELTLEEAFKLSLQSMVQMDRQQKHNERNIARQQSFIEQLHKTNGEQAAKNTMLEARIELLEQMMVKKGHKGNGEMKKEE